MKYFKFLWVAALIALVGCEDFEPIELDELPYVNYNSIKLYTGEHAAAEKTQLQLIGTPADVDYVWSSQDPTIVTVDQTGLAKAVSPGFTTITVASAVGETKVDVYVSEYIPMEGFTIAGEKNLMSTWGNVTQIHYETFPKDASESNLVWTSSDEKVARVYNNGKIIAGDPGQATITVSGGGVEKTINFVVTRPVAKGMMSILGDTSSDMGGIGFSDQQAKDGGGITAILDGSLSTFWHSRYSPNAPYPHWFIVDLGEETNVAQVAMARRNGDARGQKGYYIYTCTEAGVVDPADPTTWTWVEQANVPFSKDLNGLQYYPLFHAPAARYIKIYMGKEHQGSGDLAMVSEFSVFAAN